MTIKNPKSDPNEQILLQGSGLPFRAAVDRKPEESASHHIKTKPNAKTIGMARQRRTLADFWVAGRPEIKTFHKFVEMFGHHVGA